MDYRDHFGFGTMRMPVMVKDDPTSFDFDEIERLFDTFIEKGFRYFDTAYTYHSYNAEKAIRKALSERHAREDFELATKLPLRDFKDEEDMENIFNEQLENCGVDYFDYYLLHNMGSNVYDRCVKYKAFDFVAKKKAEGRIRHVGMSFHDMPALLEEILEKYGDRLDFIQLQINYIDWEEANVQSRKCLEIAQKYNKPVIVMEPCKGGTLANVPDEAAKLMKESAPERSIASWAMRFAAGCPGVIKVLSGMNSMDQLEDNCSVFADFEPLNEDEMVVIDKVRQIIHSNTAIPCTGCEYCTHGCPKNIAIPQYFSAYNSIMRTSGSFSSQSVYYNNLVLAGHGKASDCIKCGKCEAACPQHLPIREYLETVADKMEHTSILPVRKA